MIPTMEHALELHCHGMKVNDVQAVAEYNVDAMPELVEQLKMARWYVEKVMDDAIVPKFSTLRLRSIDAALDAAIEHEDGAS